MDTQILAFGALAVLVWAGIVLARGSLVGTALAVLIAGSCFGYAFFHVDAGRVPLTADRLLLLVLVAQYAIYRHWGRINLVPLLKADYVLGALLIVLAVSTLVHDYSALRFQPLARLTFLFLMPGVLYWTVRHGEWTGRMAWGVFATLAVFGLYLCATTIAETQGAWAYVFPGYIAAGELGNVQGGGRGPFLNPLATGLIQTLGMCAALVLWPRFPLPGKVLLVGLLGWFAAGIYSTQEPSVWLGAGVALTVILVAHLPGGWPVRAAVVSAAAAILVAGGSWWHLSTGQHGADTVARAADRSHQDQAAAAWRMFLKQPLLGCGLGQTARAAPPFRVASDGTLSRDESRAATGHNVFLSLLVDTGVLGLGLFVTLLGCWTHTAWRLHQAASVPRWARQMALLFLAFLPAYLVCALFNDLSAIPMINMFLFFLGGSVMGLVPWLADSPTEMRIETWRRQEQHELVAS